MSDELRLEIDEFRLDEEWVGQPKLFHVWVVKHADAVRRLDEAKAKLELAKADLDREIRGDPESYGLAKLTEKVVEATIAQQPGYRAATKAVYDAKHDVGVLSAAVQALDQRKRALEKLVDLHGQDYFATPRASEQNREVVEEMEKNAIRRRSKRRRKNE